MQAITIRQPYASLIMAGIKTIETRSRPTKIRGRVLIHAGKIFDPGIPVFDADGYGAWPFITDLLIKRGARFDHEFQGYYQNLPLGKILGSVEITDCIPAGEWIEQRMGKGNGSRDEYDREFALGDMSSNRFCWVLRDPRPFSQPIKAKGQQGFWRFELSDVDKNLFFAHSI